MKIPPWLFLIVIPLTHACTPAKEDIAPPVQAPQSGVILKQAAF
jgi:hypothetical protein